MKEIVDDPATLTKAKLKEELKRHNIKLPTANSKKQVYIDLYLAHISNNNSKFEENNVEITEIESSEEEGESETYDSETENINASAINLEEFENPKKAIANSQKGNRTEASTSTMSNTPVANLSDEELADELKNLGFVPGPIIASTRKAYEKKLVRLRQSAGGDTSFQQVIQLSQYEEVPDDDDYDPPPREPARPRVTRRSAAARRVVEDEEDETPERTHISSSAGQQENSTDNQVQTKSGIPVWIKFLILLGVIFFVYLIVINMDPSSDSKVPKSITDDSDVP
ncbi:hypothetical protein KUTeg_021000 [Tegillarca granosa]|uniref:Uncharacterized protein n=1 Tax=Tegillarca granosa TaxID=220873 RepID=A0ABQ9E9J9_TEGGR|nr:hypothetical protein KUTeg_021000 [Tegillarca granosa]